MNDKPTNPWLCESDFRLTVEQRGEDGEWHEAGVVVLSEGERLALGQFFANVDVAEFQRLPAWDQERVITEIAQGVSAIPTLH